VTPYVIDVVAILEQALAFAYTGDARVTMAQLMTQFGLKWSLIEKNCLVRALDFDHNISHNPIK